MLLAVKHVRGATVLVNLSHIKIIEPDDGGSMIVFPEGEAIPCTTTMEAWGEMPFVQKMFRGRL